MKFEINKCDIDLNEYTLAGSQSFDKLSIIISSR